MLSEKKKKRRNLNNQELINKHERKIQWDLNVANAATTTQREEPLPNRLVLLCTVRTKGKPGN